MSAVTAEYASAFRIPRANENQLSAEKTERTRRYLRFYYFANRLTYRTEWQPAARIFGPSLRAPSWLSAVERRIRDSTHADLSISSSRENADGRFLTREVANAAISFFRQSADLLPSEPYIYSSQQGDLVAEFESKHGILTSVISPNWVILFAGVHGMPVERTVQPQQDSAAAVRSAVRDIADMLRTGHHGTVDAGR